MEQPAGLRVLVVDDSAVNRRMAVMMFAKLGVAADAVDDGLQALEAIERVPYALVLMDCRMPLMDGLSATRELRRREGGRRRLPVVASTASEAEELKGCLEAGMDGCVAKPLRPADLQRVLRFWAAPVSQDALRRVAETFAGAPEALAALVSEFVASGAALSSTIRSAAAAEDRGGLSSAAHALKGACLNFGARPLAYLCSRLESMAERGQAPACRAFAEAAGAEFERVCTALESSTAVSFRRP